MAKFRVIYTSAASEPRTAVTATTSLAGFIDGATFWAYGSACRRRACWCANVPISQIYRKTRNSRCSAISIYIPSSLDLCSQAFRPSNHLCAIFLLPGPPQFLYQPPPGAQQLTRPDFSNVPHVGHVIVLATVDAMDVLLIKFLIVAGRRDTYFLFGLYKRGGLDLV